MSLHDAWEGSEDGPRRYRVDIDCVPVPDRPGHWRATYGSIVETMPFPWMAVALVHRQICNEMLFGKDGFDKPDQLEEGT